MITPVIRLEVEGMKHTLLVALSQHSAQMDSDIKAAVEAYCTSDNIRRILEETVNSTLNHVIREEVEKFFHYGEGRKTVAEAVKKKLLEGMTHTPLDEVTV